MSILPGWRFLPPFGYSIASCNTDGARGTEGNVVSFITFSASCGTSPTLHRRKLSRLGHRFLGFLTLALDTFERLLRGNSDRLSY